IPEHRPFMSLSGLEPFELTTAIPFVNVGERTNVTGSARFRQLITNADFTKGMSFVSSKGSRPDSDMKGRCSGIGRG
ncbi:hypothetical protein ACC756_39305, partial [Rhizobium ruizarguesonis]